MIAYEKLGILLGQIDDLQADVDHLPVIKDDLCCLYDMLTTGKMKYFQGQIELEKLVHITIDETIKDIKMGMIIEYPEDPIRLESTYRTDGL